MTHTATRTTDRGRTGFTLVEMLVVLAIISLLLGIAVPFLAMGMKRNEIDRASVIVKLTALEARSKAVEKRARYAIDMHTQANPYDDSGTNLTGVFVRDVANDKPIGVVRALPDTVRLVLGNHADSLVFTASGGLNTGTDLNGFFLVGNTNYEGATTGGSSSTLTASGSPLSTSYENYYVVILTGASGVRGQVRLIQSNTADTVTIAGTWNAPAGGEQFAIVAPNNIRKAVILSTTGQALVDEPQKVTP